MREMLEMVLEVFPPYQGSITEQAPERCRRALALTTDTERVARWRVVPIGYFTKGGVMDDPSTVWQWLVCVWLSLRIIGEIRALK